MTGFPAVHDDVAMTHEGMSVGRVSFRSPYRGLVAPDESIAAKGGGAEVVQSTTASAGVELHDRPALEHHRWAQTGVDCSAGPTNLITVF